MLAKLQQIVQRVNAAANLHEALEIVVHRVKAAMDTDVCSVYVRDPAAPQYVLMATQGLNPDSVGKVRIAAGEGIVGLVATRQEPVNLAHAAEHPSYRHFPETGEQQFSGGTARAFSPVHGRARRTAKIATRVCRRRGCLPGDDRRATRSNVELCGPWQRHSIRRTGPSWTHWTDSGVAGSPRGDDRQHCPSLSSGRT